MKLNMTNFTTLTGFFLSRMTFGLTLEVFSDYSELLLPKFSQKHVVN